MKKFFLIAVAACVALASCTKNEVAPTDPQEITYQAVVGKSTNVCFIPRVCLSQSIL